MLTGKISTFFFITIGVMSLTQLTLCSVIRTPEKADTISMDTVTKSLENSEVKTKGHSTDMKSSTSNTKVISTTEFNKSNGHFENDVTDEEDLSDVTSSEEIKDTAVDKFATELENFIFKEFNVFSNKSLGSLKDILENVIQDVDIYDGVNKKKIEAEIEPLKKFISKLQEFKEEEEDNDIRENLLIKFYLLATIAETLNAFNTTLVKKPSSEIIFVEKLLKKNYIEFFVSELDQSAERFMQHFKSNAQEIWQKLPADERGSKKVFEQFLENFESDSNLLKFFKTFYNWHRLDEIFE